MSRTHWRPCQWHQHLLLPLDQNLVMGLVMKWALAHQTPWLSPLAGVWWRSSLLPQKTTFSIVLSCFRELKMTGSLYCSQTASHWKSKPWQRYIATVACVWICLYGLQIYRIWSFLAMVAGIAMWDTNRVPREPREPILKAISVVGQQPKKIYLVLLRWWRAGRELLLPIPRCEKDSKGGNWEY